MSRGVTLKVIWCLFILCGLNMTPLVAEAWNVQQATGEKRPTKLFCLFCVVVRLSCTRDRHCPRQTLSEPLSWNQIWWITGSCLGKNNRATVRKEEELVLHNAATFHATCFSLLQKSSDWLKYRNNKEDWLAGGFRHKFFCTGKSNSRLNFIWSLTLSVLCKILFRGWRHIVH